MAGRVNLEALLYDLYFWAALVLFILSAAGIFWILKSIQGETDEKFPEEEPLPQRIARIEEALAKIDRKLSEQNHDQMNEMAAQLKLIVQSLKALGSAEGGRTDAALHQKVDKVYQILSALSRTETK